LKQSERIGREREKIPSKSKTNSPLGMLFVRLAPVAYWMRS